MCGGGGDAGGQVMRGGVTPSMSLVDILSKVSLGPQILLSLSPWQKESQCQNTGRTRNIVPGNLIPSLFKRNSSVEMSDLH